MVIQQENFLRCGLKTTDVFCEYTRILEAARRTNQANGFTSRTTVPNEMRQEGKNVKWKQNNRASATNMRSFDDKHPIMFHVALGIVGFVAQFLVALSFGAARSQHDLLSTCACVCVCASIWLSENETENFRFHENARSDCARRSRMGEIFRAHTHTLTCEDTSKRMDERLKT